MVLFSNAIFAAKRCCACAVDKIPLSVSLHYRDTSKFKCHFNNMSRYLDWVVVSRPGDSHKLTVGATRVADIRLGNHSWHFVMKDGQHIPLLTARAQHLKVTNIAVENNTTCIGIVWYFFQSVLVHCWTYRLKIQRISMIVILGNYFGIHPWDSTPSTIYMYVLKTYYNTSRKFWER